MDKVKVILEYLRKYHFWLLCVVAIAASLMGWSMARGTLSEEYNRGKSTIESKFASLNTIEDDPSPPNDKWKEAIDKLTDQGREKVATAWQSVYGEQQKVLKWPEKILGRQMVGWIESNKPDAVIPPDWCLRYRNEVVNVEFPKLVEIVGAELKIEDAENSNRLGNADGSPRDYKVDWSQDSQQDVQQWLRMADEGVPSSQVVRLRQEDFWVFRALLNIINATNEGARYSSHVKQINALSIGAKAAGEFQKGMRPGHIQLSINSDGEQEPAAFEEPLEEGIEQAPDAGRYVDASGNPLGAGVAATEQFKRLPVYLNLQMNQNEISTLLAHCANYPLPVEVKQLRINPDSKGNSPKQSNAGSLPAVDDDDLSRTTPGRLDVTVEIHGIIYIYNPPDPAKLGLPEGAMAGIGG